MGRNLQRHHILSSDVIKKNPNSIPAGLNRNNAPAIQMTPADHRKTKSWGNKRTAREYRAAQAKLLREGNIDEVFRIEITSLRELFGSKYDDALSEMIQDAKKRGFITDAVQL